MGNYMSGDNQRLELIWENQFYRRLCFTMETMRIEWGESILVVGCSVHQNCAHSSVLVLFFFAQRTGFTVDLWQVMRPAGSLPQGMPRMPGSDLICKISLNPCPIFQFLFAKNFALVKQLIDPIRTLKNVS